MNRCATCRHWLPVERSGFSPPGDIGHIATSRGMGACGKMPSASDLTDDFPVEPLALLEDLEDRAAVLRTAPEFGCVMHEEKT